MISSVEAEYSFSQCYQESCLVLHIINADNQGVSEEESWT